MNIKIFNRLIIILILICANAACEKSLPEFKEGDIIFQTSKSSQSQAIQLATHSKYSHMGIIYRDNGKQYVYEATASVKLTPIKEWLKRGEGGRYAVKRLKENKLLTSDVLKRMRLVRQQFKGKSYDVYFEWDDERIYCSELVYKIYKLGANIELGRLEKLRDFNLTDPIVKQKLKERFGDTIPYDEIVISPKTIFNDEKLREVYSNY